MPDVSRLLNSCRFAFKWESGAAAPAGPLRTGPQRVISRQRADPHHRFSSAYIRERPISCKTRQPTSTRALNIESLCVIARRKGRNASSGGTCLSAISKKYWHLDFLLVKNQLSGGNVYWFHWYILFYLSKRSLANEAQYEGFSPGTGPVHTSRSHFTANSGYKETSTPPCDKQWPPRHISQLKANVFFYVSGIPQDQQRDESSDSHNDLQLNATD